MLKKIFIFLLGIILISYSLMLIIIYLNLLKMGFTFLEYIKFIFTKCFVTLIIGCVLIYFSIKQLINE